MTKCPECREPIKVSDTVVMVVVGRWTGRSQEIKFVEVARQVMHLKCYNK